MATPTRMIHVRIDNKIKNKATRTLEAMGLSMSEAVRLFLYRVASDEALPFEIKVPNAKTRAAMAEAEDITKSRPGGFRQAEELFASLEEDSRK